MFDVKFTDDLNYFNTAIIIYCKVSISNLSTEILILFFFFFL